MVTELFLDLGLANALLLCGLMLRTHWFEKAIFTWGWITGVMAMGIALLRIVDPDNRSNVLDSFAVAYLFIVPIEVGLVALAPQLIAQGYAWLLTIGTGVAAVILVTLFSTRRNAN